jgi:hypothetical protein
MTQREFFTEVIAANINDEMTAFARAAVEKLNKRNVTRASKPTKSQQANEIFKTEIIEFLTDKEGYTLCSTIAEHFGVKTQKASAVLGLMVKDGTIEAADVKVPKQGKRKGYKLVTNEEKGD